MHSISKAKIVRARRWPLSEMLVSDPLSRDRLSFVLFLQGEWRHDGRISLL